MTMTRNRKLYNDMIDECYEHESKLTDWEGKFLEDISNQLCESPTLSEAQEAELERIHRRVTQ